LTADAERDADAGYPKSFNVDENTHKFILSHLDQASGRHMTEHEVAMRAEALEEARLAEASQKKAFQVPPRMLNDWPGDRFTSTHRCFGEPCKQTALMQATTPDGPSPSAPASGVKSFRIGDMQEHRYPTTRAWKQNAWPH